MIHSKVPFAVVIHVLSAAHSHPTFELEATELQGYAGMLDSNLWDALKELAIIDLRIKSAC